MDHIRENKDFYWSLNWKLLAVLIIGGLLMIAATWLGVAIVSIAGLVFLVYWFPYTLPATIFMTLLMVFGIVYSSIAIVLAIVAAIMIAFILTWVLRITLWPYQIVDNFLIANAYDSTIRIVLWGVAGALYLIQHFLF
jgi:hypothetical protein